MKLSLARSVLFAAMTVALAGGLAGCADNLPILEKGVYKGQPDQTLDEATLKALKERSRRQSYN